MEDKPNNAGQSGHSENETANLANLLRMFGD
jgi:hypothetical protein